ncbi:hypothetical protein ACT3SP_14475 [Brachybacterium sp. AOP43-C2-M15]|uniref:hypothetical protein n=1 Tax=Brachybacterium sp. AOP43-C2-M15 TaxID=3457661 RepID=UPI004033C28F
MEPSPFGEPELRLAAFGDVGDWAVGAETALWAVVGGEASARTFADPPEPSDSAGGICVAEEPPVERPWAALATATPAEASELSATTPGCSAGAPSPPVISAYATPGTSTAALVPAATVQIVLFCMLCSSLGALVCRPGRCLGDEDSPPRLDETSIRRE